jgi:hypothetical protein
MRLDEGGKRTAGVESKSTRTSLRSDIEPMYGKMIPKITQRVSTVNIAGFYTCDLRKDRKELPFRLV